MSWTLALIRVHKFQQPEAYAKLHEQLSRSVHKDGARLFFQELGPSPNASSWIEIRKDTYDENCIIVEWGEPGV